MAMSSGVTRIFTVYMQQLRLYYVYDRHPILVKYYE